MDADNVGLWRWCPACGAPIMEPQYASEDPDDPSFNFENVRCAKCERPWIACPCEKE